MGKLNACCFSGGVFYRDKNKLQRLEETMEESSTDSFVNSLPSEGPKQDGGTKNSPALNIIENHDFSWGLQSWHLNGCHGYVAFPNSSTGEERITTAGSRYTVVTNRRECWHGLEQDITARVSVGSTYRVSARVGVSGGHLQGCTDVIATIKLEQHGSETQFMFIAKTSVSKDHWGNLEGTFVLSNVPDRVVFYFEGPPPGVDLLIESVVINSARIDNDTDVSNTKNNVNTNIIENHDFSGGLHLWQPNCCDAFVVSPDPGINGENSTRPGSRYAVITNRKFWWHGLEQDITSRVSTGCTYNVSARVRVSEGHLEGFADFIATLRQEYHGSETRYHYICIGKASVSKDRWDSLEGTFLLSSMPDRVIVHLEGPPPELDLLIESVVVSAGRIETISADGCVFSGDENIILNPEFEDGLNNWSGRGCKIALHDSMGDGKVLPQSGKFFASATERTQSWNGIQQDISARVQRKLAYDVSATVRIFGDNVTSADVRATLWVQMPDLREQYIGIAKSVPFFITPAIVYVFIISALICSDFLCLQATDKDWIQLQGKFLLNGSPSKVVVYLEGPPPGTDILLNGLVVKHAQKIPPLPPPVVENVAFGVNIITNGNLNDGTNGWFPLGSCSLSVGAGSPHILPPMARESLGPHEPLSGRYILVTNRTQTWMGPAQMVTDKVKLFLTYQVSAWVRIGPGSSGPQNINVALGVDSQWVNGGQVEITDDRWHEIGGSFRIEKEANKVMVYVQGPAPGVNFMVGGLQIFPVDRHARFKHLRHQTDKIRKRDVILKFSGSSSTSLQGNHVKVRQLDNTFPLGTCISRSNIDNEDFVDFFTKHFNWSVFGNELKWYWTESQQGNFNYRDADDLLTLCTSHNIQARGHCIFWEVESAVQPWVKALNQVDLMSAVQSRLNGLLNRYKGKFKHYDVNNEMLHGSFYQDRLGKDIRAQMFKTANQLDPSATLFVNDYHVEDGCDPRSSPEKYIDQILGLQEQGAVVGGIGVQGHIDSPVGPIICSALDKLGILGLPIWFTELDVSSTNEFVRADDFEVMLREAFAHPSVEGVMLWGFWELFMSRDNSHLVNAEGDINEAGKRLLSLKQEWMSGAHGHVDEQGQFVFRGFQGNYEVEVAVLTKKVVKKFEVADNGDSPVVVSIDL